jgi:hypothetical protein
MKSLAPSALVLAVLFAGGAFAQQSAPQTLSNGLQRVQGSKLALAYVRSGTVWSKYRTVMLRPLQIPPNVRNAAPPGAFPQFGESYIIPDSDIAQLKQAFANSFQNALTNAGFKLVTTPQADTLIVYPEIKKILLAAPVQNTRETYSGMGFTVSQGGGSITMAAVLADGGTKTVIAEVEDRQYGSNIYGLNNSVTNFAQARDAFDTWANDLVNALQSK